MRKENTWILMLVAMLLMVCAEAAADAYPKESYRLSADGDTLLQWTGKEAEIDMASDSALANVRHIAKRAVSHDELTYFGCSEMLESFDMEAFYTCSGLKAIYIGKGLKSIPKDGFGVTPALTDITVSPENPYYTGTEALVSDVRTRAVVYCGGGVSEVEVPDGTERIEDFAFYCAGITKVSLPEGLKHIGEEAFCFATKLKEAHLPKSVETVDASAFYACDELQSVTLPASVKSLEKLCFAFCSSLKSMIVLSTTPPTLPAIGGDDDAFWYTDLSHTTLYVPQESLEQYKADQGWSRFQTIVGVPKPDAQVLIVTTTDGARTEFLLEEQPKVYNRGTNLEITSRATTITLPLSKLKRMTFRPADGTSINEVKKDGSDKESPREMLNFSQLPPRSKIEVFASDGRLLKSERTCNASSALNLDELGRGLFIVRINGVTYKISRR